MNLTHLRFCRQHDWGRHARLENGKIVNLREDYMDADGTNHTGTIAFSDWRELLAWAGY